MAGRPLREWGERLVHDADTRRARLLGLAFLRELPPGVGLRFPHTRSVHTFGMRFALDLHWIGQGGDVVRVDRGVPPRRVRGCREAASVIEFAAVAPDQVATPRQSSYRVRR